MTIALLFNVVQEKKSALADEDEILFKRHPFLTHYSDKHAHKYKT